MNQICQRCFGYGKIPLNNVSGPVMTNYNSYTCQLCNGTGQFNGRYGGGSSELINNYSDSSNYEYDEEVANCDGAGFFSFLGGLTLLGIAVGGWNLLVWISSYAHAH